MINVRRGEKETWMNEFYVSRVDRVFEEKEEDGCAFDFVKGLKSIDFLREGDEVSIRNLIDF